MRGGGVVVDAGRIVVDAGGIVVDAGGGGDLRRWGGGSSLTRGVDRHRCEGGSPSDPPCIDDDLHRRINYDPPRIGDDLLPRTEDDHFLN